MKPIYYLSYSDKPRTTGLIFPNELLENSYSPGIWVVDLKKFELLPGEFEFDAVDNNELLTFKMTRVDGTLFHVSTDKYGKFYFRVMSIYFRHKKYVGNS